MPLLCWYDDITGRIIETASRMRESQKRHFQFTLRIWIDLFLKNKLPQHRPVDIHTPHTHKKETSEFFSFFNCCNFLLNDNNVRSMWLWKMIASFPSSPEVTSMSHKNLPKKVHEWGGGVGGCFLFRQINDWKNYAADWNGRASPLEASPL